MSDSVSYYFRCFVTAVVAVVSDTLSEAVDVEHEAALDVRCLILVDGVVLCKFVEHLLHLGEEGNCLSLVGGSAKFANSVAHRLGIVTVVETAGSGLADALH